MITRRDFLDGMALADWPATAAHAAGSLAGQTDAAAAAAHRLRDDPQWARRADAVPDDGIEDLVVVGAGLSGLAAAWWWQRYTPAGSRILLIDPLDQPGGHARRNEFTSRSGRTLVGYGGSQSLDTPSFFSPAMRATLDGLGIDLRRFGTEWFDHDWARRHRVTGSALWFDGRPLAVRRPKQDPAAWVAGTPLPAVARRDWLRLREGRRNVLPGLTRAQRLDRLAEITYDDFLRLHWRVHPDVRRLHWPRTLGYFGVGTDATSALDAWAAGLPGFDGLALGDRVDPRLSASARLLMRGPDDYIHHFPDGNATVARALLRDLVPGSLPAGAIESLATAPLDRAALDRPEAPVRLRLGATALVLRHLGEPARAEAVEIRYLDAGGTLRAVRARAAVLACWHRVIARLTDELPPAQTAALDDQVKVPLVYANVLVSNWRPWQRAGIGSFQPVDGFWHEVSLDFPVSLGGVRFAQSPDEPMLLHCAKVVVPGDGRAPREQSAAGRALLAQWTFDHFEAQTRRTLQGALGAQGFDADRDIEAITVNRWPHGYALEYARPWDAFWPQGPLPCELARRGWGRVALANSDAGAYAYAHSAVDQAVRAVAELLPRAPLPLVGDFPGPPRAALG